MPAAGVDRWQVELWLEGEATDHGRRSDGAGQAAAAASPDEGPALRFGGSEADLRLALLALLALEGGAFDAPGAWFPADARIRFRRLGGGDAAAEEAGPRYELCLGPEDEAQQGRQQGRQQGQRAGAGRSGPAPRVAQLSRPQLAALLDCLDALCQAHPALLPPPTGRVAEPRRRRRWLAWLGWD